MKELETAFSSCPNDTFIFHAMLFNKVDTGQYKFNPYISDIADLNMKAFNGKYTITKLSFYTYFLLKERYSLLNSGAALGYGCGPLLIAKDNIDHIKNPRVAIPGEQTTANLLLKIWNPSIAFTEPVRFDNIIPGILEGKFDAGLIIHEGRFIYQNYNLKKIIDLGEWWEKKTGLPIPLGCIAIKKEGTTPEMEEDINKILKRSVNFALKNPNASAEFVRSYAQEMDDDVINNHIKLYVNNFSIELGDEGRKAIEVLEEMATWKGII